jgi:hypothetical protein
MIRRNGRKRTQAALCILCLLLVKIIAVAQSSQANRINRIVLDRMAATVNGDLITESDLKWYIALDPEIGEGDRSEQIQWRALQQLIDQKLLDQEAEKLPTIEISASDVEKGVAELITRFPSESVFRRRIEAVGLDAETLRLLIKHRLEILRYIDFRFRSFVFVSDAEIQSYYESQVAARAKAQGQPAPSLDQARGLIEKIISDEKVKSEMIAWLDESRQKAEIVIFDPYRSMGR